MRRRRRGTGLALSPSVQLRARKTSAGALQRRAKTGSTFLVVFVIVCAVGRIAS